MHPFRSTPSLMEAIGSTAALCTTVSFVPQLVRVWRRKSARDISVAMFLLFSFGVGCWLVYGIGVKSRPIIAANAVTLALSIAILVLKFRYDGLPGNLPEQRPISPAKMQGD